MSDTSADKFTFGRYDYTREELIVEAQEAGKSQIVIDLLHTVPLVKLMSQAAIEAQTNPIDDETGWDETSLLLAAAYMLARWPRLLG